MRSPRSRSATRCERARLAIGKVAQCELIKNFAVEMAYPLANTGIEKDQPDRSLIDGRATTRRTISKSIFERLRG